MKPLQMVISTKRRWEAQMLKKHFCARPLSSYVSKDVALRVIASYLDYVSGEKKLIETRIETEGESRYSKICMQEAMEHIKLLQNVREEISSTENYNPLSVVAQHLTELHQKRALISEAEACLCRCTTPLSSQQNALLSKPKLMHQIEMLESIFKDISFVQLPLTDGQVVEYQLPPLMSKFMGFGEILAYTHSFEYIDFGACAYEWSLILPRLRDRLDFQSYRVLPAGECRGESIRERVVSSSDNFFWRSKAARSLEFRLSMNEMETKEVIPRDRVELESVNEQRYLCVANGIEMFCLDLKRRKDQTFSNAGDVPPLPKIATPKLYKEPLPFASLGLFKWKSNAYMISGKVVDPDGDPSNFYYRTFGKCAYLLDNLYQEGSACDIRVFSLGDNGLTISHYESNISKPNKPKFWPIVETINGEIHLIDSLPKRLAATYAGWTFSHEVLDSKSGEWIEIAFPDETLLHVNCHLVVGDYIFAISPVDWYFEDYSERSYLIFDSKTKQWKSSQRHRDFFRIKEVWDILELGPVRCAGEFFHGQSSDPLYVIIALQRDNTTNDKMGTLAVASLVTSTGQVLCIQILRNFFTGPVWPCYMFEGKLINVGEKSRTMCSIIIASAWDRWSDTDLQYLFINTFTVKKLTHVASQIRKLWAKGSKAWPVELDFVRVDVKDTCIHKIGLEEEDSVRWVGVQACFL